MPVKDSSMVQVSIDDMQRHFSTYLQQVEDGMTLLIVKAGKPLAEIKSVGSTPKTLRPFGLCAGEFTVPADFDAPLPENIVQEFEGT